MLYTWDGDNRRRIFTPRRFATLMPIPASDLLHYIFSNTRLPLAVQFSEWLQAPRFRVFAENNRDKIRKKVRGIAEAEGYRDLQAELATAYFLLLERRFLVEYEKYGVGKQRGPDFSVTYKTHIRFDVEVTRLRGGQAGVASEPGKLANTLCVKLKQLPPSIINILVLAADDSLHIDNDPSAGSGHDLESGLLRAVTLLQERAERKDDEFFTRRGFLGSRDFLKHYSRLSAIRLVTPDAPPILRLQTQARHPLPPDLATIMRR
ncbi:MAG TPA: hypothetical protein VM409_05095 [Chloroflexia bacterium]|nr:hypothetical protein [Chloroflexia bacterium]